MNRYTTSVDIGRAMAHVFEVADETFSALVATAERQGKTPDQLLEEWLEEIHRADLESTDRDVPGYDPATDPLAPYIGAFETDTPNLVRRHDHYLAEAYADNHQSD